MAQPGRLHRGDNLDYMSTLPAGSCDLIYADPPFFADHRSRNSRGCFADAWTGGMDAYLAFLRARLEQMHRLLGERGSLYVHLDCHAVHYVKVILDEVFGRRNFLNEIVWHYRTGGVARRWFGRKHDTLLLYAKKRGSHTFHVLREGRYRTDGLRYDEQDRPFKQTRGGRLYFNPDGPAMTDVWDVPFLSTVSLERTGWPSQKPEALLERVILASSDPGDTVGDFFCGSGTTLVVAKRHGREVLGCDVAPEAVRIAQDRLDRVLPLCTART
ncbi:MAG: site-specific DNA-methyltransferase [Phycisphaerae bacterium]|nr:site-specific DNA-methyltransferase [Phycisphaerae bacterium]